MASHAIWHPTHLLIDAGDVFNLEEFFKTFDSVLDDPCFKSLTYFLVDCSRVSESRLADKDRAAIAQYASITSKIQNVEKMNVAFIATSIEVLAEVQRYVEIAKLFNPNWQRAVFESEEEALKWAQESAGSESQGK